jgi:predicted porin
MEIYRMKKSLFAIAAVTAFAGAAQAQSSVTVYGIMDMGVAGGNSRSATTSGVTNNTGLGVAANGQSTSRLGFRGTEDLGGGMSAFFTFETGLLPNSNTAGQLSTFNARQAFVGLAQKGIGRVALGTQQTIVHNVVGRTTAGQQNNVVGDLIYPVNGTGPQATVSTAYGLTSGQSYAVRVQNAVTFATENLSGFQANVMVVGSGSNTNQGAGSTTTATGGQATNSGYGLGVNYSLKQLFLTANYQSFTNKTTATTNPGTSPTTAPANFGLFSPAQAATNGLNVVDNTMYFAGSYNFGILQAFAGYINRKVSAQSNSSYFQRYTAQQIGVRSNLTPKINVFASVGTGAWENTGYDSASANINGYQLGTNYILSKRTNLYAIFGNASQSNARNNGVNPATATNTSANVNNYAVGVRHTF